MSLSDLLVSAPSASRLRSCHQLQKRKHAEGSKKRIPEGYRHRFRIGWRANATRCSQLVRRPPSKSIADLHVTYFISLAVKGRLIVIGSISNYADDGKPGARATGFGDDAVRTVVLLNKSATVTGFFLPHYTREYTAALNDMMTMVANGMSRHKFYPRATLIYFHKKANYNH